MSPSREPRAPAGWIAALIEPHTALVLLMRALSLISLGTAALNWGALLGLSAEPGADVGGFGLGGRGLTLYFAVLDPIAAVGLWMTSSWGAVIWIVSALSRVALATGLIDPAEFSALALAYQVIVVGLYLVLSRRAARAAQS